MERVNQTIRRAMILSLAVWATACSDVSFTPGEGSEKFEIPETEQKETFNFNDDGVKAKVDVLFVVDNSGSMLEEQNKLGSALSSFITSLGNIDWQIGITTTDVSDGPFGIKGSLVPFTGTSTTVLNNKIPGYESIFMNTVVREELIACKNDATLCPSSDERPLEAISLAVAKAGTTNKSFYRAGADVAVVILSDEDERSTGGAGAMAPAAVVAGFNAMFKGTKTLSSYGIIIEPGDKKCYDFQRLTNTGSYGTFASQLAALTDGETGSLCATDYGPTLTSIGNRVKNMAKSITLKYTPDPATVQVTMTPFDSSITWEIIGNTIRFSKTPKKGTKVVVVYLPEQPDEP